MQQIIQAFILLSSAGFGCCFPHYRILLYSNVYFMVHTIHKVTLKFWKLLFSTQINMCCYMMWKEH